ncbi:MAG: hypothetical protein WDA22_16745 [Bacteroidota bacterium]
MNTMNASKLQWITFPPNWTWVAVGYCYFILGHLLPIAIMQWLSGYFLFLKVVIAGWAFGGLAVIAFIIGFRSRGVTVLEAVISSILYTLTMSVAVAGFWTKAMDISGQLWFILAIVASAISSVIGEIIQHSIEKQQ